MNDIKDKLAIGSTAALLGAVFPALISLGIFATKADVAELRAESAEKYVTEVEQERVVKPVLDHLQRLEDKLDRLVNQVKHRD